LVVNSIFSYHSSMVHALSHSINIPSIAKSIGIPLQRVL